MNIHWKCIRNFQIRISGRSFKLIAKPRNFTPKVTIDALNASLDEQNYTGHRCSIQRKTRERQRRLMHGSPNALQLWFGVSYASSFSRFQNERTGGIFFATKRRVGRCSRRFLSPPKRIFLKKFQPFHSFLSPLYFSSLLSLLAPTRLRQQGRASAKKARATKKRRLRPTQAVDQ